MVSTVKRNSPPHLFAAGDVVGPLDTFHFYRGRAREEAIGITFHCRATGGQLTLSSEHDEAKWVPIEQLLDLECASWLRRCFVAFLGRRAA